MNKGKKAQKVQAKQEVFDPKKYEKNGLTEDEVLEIKEAFIYSILIIQVQSTQMNLNKR